MRNFTEERQQQIIGEELNKVIEKVFGLNTPEGRQIADIYRQHPLLDLLFRAAEKSARTGKSPYTKPVLKALKCPSASRAPKIF